MDARTEELLLAGAAGAALGAVALYVWMNKPSNSSSAASAPAPPAAAFENAALTGGIVETTVASGQNLTTALGVGELAVVWLPLHGRWVSVDGAGITDPVSPQAFVFQGPITHSYVWVDTTTNTTQTCTIFFIVGVTTPISITT